MLIPVFALFIEAQEPNVTFTHRAGPIKQVIETLGDHCGLPMTAEKGLPESVLLLRLTDVPLGEVQSRIAKAAKGEWRNMNGVLTLFPTTRPSDAKSVALRASQLQRSIEKLLEKANLEKPLNQQDAERHIKEAYDRHAASNQDQWDFQSYTNEERSTPGARAVLRAVAALGSSELSHIAKQRRVVWSSNPTRLQRQLTDKAKQSVAICAEELAAHNLALEEFFATHERDSLAYSPLFFNAQGPEKGFTDTWLIASSDTNSNQVTFTLAVIGGGRMQSIGGLTLSPYDDADATNDHPKASLTGLSGDVKWSPLSRLIIDQQRFSWNRSKTLPSSTKTEIANEFCKLTKSEVLTTVLSDIVIQGAEKVDADVVFATSELVSSIVPAMILVDTQSRAPDIGSETIPLQKAWDKVFSNEAYVVELAGSNSIVTSNSGAFAEYGDPNIAAIEKFALYATKNGIDFDSSATFAVDCGPDGLMSSSAIMMLGFPEHQHLLGAIQVGALPLRVYGRLSESAKQRVMQGEATLALTSLDPKSQSEIRRAALLADPTLSPSAEVFSFGVSSFAEMGGGIDLEPTVRFVQGFPIDATVKISIASKESLFAINTFAPGHSYTNPTDVQGMAAQIAWGEISQERQNTKYGVSTLKSLRVSIRYFSDLFTNLQVQFMPTFEEADTFDQGGIPEKYKEEFEKALAKAREDYKGITIEPGTGRRIKP